MQRVLSLVIIVAAILAAGSWHQPATAQPDTRPFYLGFTPFPHDIGDTAANEVFDAIATDADIIAHHFDEGVPWDEALAGDPYSPNLINNWNLRLARTPAAHQSYVALTPISVQREALAEYWGAESNLPRPAPWDGYTFNHPDVMAAYLNYCRAAVEFFDPDYLTVGIEVNGLASNSPGLWDGYVELHAHVYENLKAEYPDLPVMVSLIGPALLDGYTDDDHALQMAALEDIMPYSDYFAISIYPYLTAFTTESIPMDVFDQLRALSDKPMVIAETGYPADSFMFTVEDTPFVFTGTEAKQATWIELLLDKAQEHEYRFVINFILRDYDDLWEAIARPELFVLWRDTGLYDEDNHPRPALAIWQDALARPVAPPAD